MCDIVCMFLTVLARIRWIVWGLAGVIITIGVIALTQGNAGGWLSIAVGIVAGVMQIFVNREAAKLGENSRDTIG